MADSVDRVFGHALNTINKIRTGSQKPPVADRLALYGLYKQSMEGEVTYITDRPTGSSDAVRKEQEKWDAWYGNRALSRTEAKKRYIEKLIETMHIYASSTPEARELVSELEFVWDQVKGNSNSDTSGSSPARKVEGSYPLAGEGRDGMRGEGSSGPLRVLTPAGQPVEADDDEGREEFVDAPVSQFGEQDVETPLDERADPVGKSGKVAKKRVAPGDVRGTRRVESAIERMRTEVAALRELVESRRYAGQQRRMPIFRWLLSAAWFLVKLAVADVFILWLVLLYLRRKKDRRLEGAIRVMLGDAQAVAKNLATTVQNKLPSRRQ